MDVTIFLSTPLILFLLWMFLIMIGLDTDDIFVKSLQLPLGIIFGLSLITSETLLGMIIICASIYLCVTDYKNYKKGEAL